MKIINFYRLRYLVQEPSFRFEGHRHGKYEANIVLDGTIELTCGSNIYQVDKEHFAKELGDICWYLAEAATAIGVDLESIMAANIEKLRKRYPEGFSTEDSINRVDVEK